MAKQLKNSLMGIRWFQIAMICALASVIILFWLGLKIYQTHIYHWHLEHKSLNQTTLFGKQLPQAIFANAVRYGHQGQADKALATYAVVAAKTDDDVLRRAAYYNAGNLYLIQATDKLEKEGLPGWDVAGPLVALAKESYQKALRIYPQWSEAKYNYQLALRLAPTTHGMRGPQQYEDENIKQEEKPSGWPAMPGNPRGMP